MPRIKAYYADGSVYDSWDDMPESGVLVIVETRDTGRTIYTGGDWYYLDDGQVKYISSGEWGTWKPKPDIPCKSCIKKGVGVSDEEFQAAVDRALDGTD